MSTPLTPIAAPVQQQYVRGDLAERIQRERDAAATEEFLRHRRVTLTQALLLDAASVKLGEAMARMRYDRTGGLLDCEDVQKIMIEIAKSLREQIVSPDENEKRKAERQHAAGAARL